jgi:hypothetical protein
MNRGRLFCAPEKIGLNSQNYQQILESYLPAFTRKIDWPTSAWKSVDDVPVGFVLMEALLDAFPVRLAAKNEGNKVCCFPIRCADNFDHCTGLVWFRRLEAYFKTELAPCRHSAFSDL